MPFTKTNSVKPVTLVVSAVAAAVVAVGATLLLKK